MKQKKSLHIAPAREVAPITGAWIETIILKLRSGIVPVAPITGAWIETMNEGRSNQVDRVAPITGAWIETEYEFNIGIAVISR